MVKASKGSSFERDISRTLSTWIQGTDHPLLFWRGRGSGGMLTRNFNVGVQFSGDIYALDPKSMWVTDVFSIEAKNGYPGASFDKHLKDNKNDEVRAFWTQCCSDAIKVNKRPLLIFKKLRNTPWLGLDYDTKTQLDHLISDLKCIHLHWEEDAQLRDLYFFEMKQFFTTVTAETIKSIFVK